MPWKRKRSCVNNHPMTPENIAIEKRQIWLKRTEEWKEFLVRRCRRCQCLSGRLSARRQRAIGTRESYPVWAARRAGEAGKPTSPSTEPTDPREP